MCYLHKYVGTELLQLNECWAKDNSIYKYTVQYSYSDTQALLYNVDRAQIFKLLRSQGINSKESIPPAYVSWLAGKTTLSVVPIRAST